MSSKGESNDSLPKFPKEKAKEIADFIMKDVFEDPQFNFQFVQDFLKIITDGISMEVKNAVEPYFAVFVQLTLLENIGQAIFSGSMSLWDQRTDDYVSTKYATEKFTCICNIYGVYSPG